MCIELIAVPLDAIIARHTNYISTQKNPAEERLSSSPGLSFQFGKLGERLASIALILQLSAADSPFTAERLIAH